MTPVPRMNRRGFASMAGGAVVAGAIGAPSAAEASAAAATDATGAIRRWARAWNEADPARMAALFTTDGSYTDHAFRATFRGREGVAQWVTITVGVIADARVEITDAFRKGSRGAARWTFSGTFVTDRPFGPEAIGKSFSVPAASHFRFRGRRIHAVEDFYNLADLLRQLGLPAGPYAPPQQPS